MNYGIPGLNEAASKLLTVPFAESFRREKLAVFQQKHAMRSETSAENQVRAVRLAVSRLHKHLAAAMDGHGQRQPVLRPFADHLAKYLHHPAVRFNGRMGARTRAVVAGRFTCEPPPGMVWSG